MPKPTTLATSNRTQNPLITMMIRGSNLSDCAHIQVRFFETILMVTRCRAILFYSYYSILPEGHVNMCRCFLWNLLSSIPTYIYPTPHYASLIKLNPNFLLLQLSPQETYTNCVSNNGAGKTEVCNSVIEKYIACSTSGK